MTDPETTDALPDGTTDAFPGTATDEGATPEAPEPGEQDEASDAPADEGRDAPAAEAEADANDEAETDEAETDEAETDEAETDEAETDEAETDEADAEEADAEDDTDAEAEAEDDSSSAPGVSLPLPAVVEAILFAAREPLKLQNIARAAGKGTKQDAVREAMAELNLHYLETGRAFEIAEISSRYQLMSRPEYAGCIARLYPKRQGEEGKAARLTAPALETLAVIAYKQPATRAEIERIRGCGCGPALRSLVERGSVRVAGKRTDLVGQPLLYGTTEAFLAEFGLGSLDELPLRSEFMAPPVEQEGLGGGPAHVLNVAAAPEGIEIEGAESAEGAEPAEPAHEPEPVAQAE